MKEKKVRISITLDKKMLEDLEKISKDYGMNRSQCLQYLMKTTLNLLPQTTIMIRELFESMKVPSDPKDFPEWKRKQLESMI